MSRLSWLLLLCALYTSRLTADVQESSSLAQIKKLYVEPFDNAGQSSQLRQSLLRRLQKSGYLIVNSAKDADATIKGSGQIWIKGHVTNNSRNPSSNLQPVYGGFLSVEIHGHDGEPLWSYLVTPSTFAWTGVADNLAGNLVKQLLADSKESASTGNAGPQSQPSLQRTDLSGAGATFPAPLYRRWFQSFQQLHPEVHFAYDAVGSEEGSRRLAHKAVDFAASDAVSGPESGDGNSSHIASVLGGVVPIYKLDGTSRDLRFTPETLADIYLGKIKKWNDPAIKSSNPGIDLPDREIVVVHRSDGSGTTYVLSDFLSKVSPAWKTGIGTGSTLSWPVGIAAVGNEGVASRVQATPNSIGYVELVYAIQHRLSFGAVRNSAGEYVRASVKSLMEAARNAPEGDSGALVSITNPPGKDAYPIASFTWMLYPQQINDPAKKTALLAFFRWILTSGQKECSALGYAPVPHEVAARQLERLSSAK